MLFDAKMPNMFWGEAVMMANFLQNRLPTRGADVTPFEGWFERKPNIKLLQKFGSSCYVYIPEEKRQKLDKKATKMVLVGYDLKSKAYRCFDPIKRTVAISRDVRFGIQNSSQFQEEKMADTPNFISTNVENDFYTELGDDNLANEQINDGEPNVNADENLIEARGNNIEEENEAADNVVAVNAAAGNAVAVRRSERSNFGVPPKRYTYSRN